MAAFTEQPMELLRLILLHLADIDLSSFFIVRRCCRVIQTDVTDIVDMTFSTHGLAIHALLKAQFSPS